MCVSLRHFDTPRKKEKISTYILLLEEERMMGGNFKALAGISEFH